MNTEGMGDAPLAAANVDAACAAENFVPGVGAPQALLLELRGARDRRSWRCAPVGP